MRLYDMIRELTFTDDPDAEVVVQMIDKKGNDTTGELRIESTDTRGYHTVVLYVEEPST